MAEVNLTRLGDEFVFHFGGNLHQIRAETFAKSLIEISAALKEINRSINPDYNVEIYIDALGPGSFRARITALRKKASPLLGELTKNILIGLFTAVIYQKFIAQNPDIQINVLDDSYVVVHGDQTIILPREVAEAKKKVDQNPEVDRRVSNAFQMLNDDPEIENFGITENLDDESPLIEFPRSQFPILSERQELIVDEETYRVKPERTELIITRAILERGKRKWEFIWRDGIKISAPVLDNTFYDKLLSHEYVLGTGDSIETLLLIHQRRDEFSEVWINEKYEVSEVYAHTAGPKQGILSAEKEDMSDDVLVDDITWDDDSKHHHNHEDH